MLKSICAMVVRKKVLVSFLPMTLRPWGRVEGRGGFLKVVRIRWNQKSMNVFVWEIRKSG